MMGKAGAEKRPSQSLALHCSDRCALQKEKDKDSIQRQMYNTGTKKANKKTGIHYAETTKIYKDRCTYTQLHRTQKQVLDKDK